MEAISCYDGHDGKPVNTKDAIKETSKTTSEDENLDGEIDWGDAFNEATPTEDSKPQAEEVAIDLGGKEKFSRDGAKYVCNNCGEKYFTRMEVINCYDEH